MLKLNEYESIAVEACKLGGEVLKKYFNRISDFDEKTDAGIVTKADKESEQIISNFFAKQTPDFSILAEESGLTEKGKNRWIIDPLDGTTNFFHGFPHFNISIGLELDGEIVVGVVYNPITEEFYHSQKGNGAYRNNKRIHVSKINNISNCLLGTGFAYMRGQILDDSLEVFRRFTYACHGIRRPGAAALDLCYVACGIYDGFYEKTLKPWDVAAGYLIINEAGGKVTNYTGNPFSVYSNDLVSSNGLIHDEMLKIINYK